MAELSVWRVLSNWPAIIFWPAIVAGLAAAGIGIAWRRTSLLIVGACLMLPAALYLAATPRFRFIGLVPVVSLFLAAWALRREKYQIGRVLVGCGCRLLERRRLDAGLSARATSCRRGRSHRTRRARWVRYSWSTQVEGSGLHPGQYRRRLHWGATEFRRYTAVDAVFRLESVDVVSSGGCRLGDCREAGGQAHHWFGRRQGLIN